MQNVLLAIAQDPCIKRKIKNKAREILNCDYTPILSLKSHRQAGIEAQEAIDSLNYFEQWVEKGFPTLYYKKHNIRDIKNPLLERVSDVDLLRISSCLRAEILSKALPAHVGTDFFDTLRILAPVEMGDLMLSPAMKLQRVS